MDSMLSAIRARRSGGQSQPKMGMNADAPPSAPDNGQDQGMRGLVESLNDDQKKELLSQLAQSLGAGNALGIEKGEPSLGEKVDIEAQAAEGEGDMAESGSGLSQDESDEIQAGLVDSRAMNMSERGERPRNLSERAKMNAAEKLKAKGKLK